MLSKAAFGDKFHGNFHGSGTGETESAKSMQMPFCF